MLSAFDFSCWLLLVGFSSLGFGFYCRREMKKEEKWHKEYEKKYNRPIPSGQGIPEAVATLSSAEGYGLGIAIGICFLIAGIIGVIGYYHNVALGSPLGW